MNEYDPKVGGTLNEAVYKQPMRMWNGYVVLQHDSSRKITNGVIDHTSVVSDLQSDTTYYQDL